MQLSGLLLTVVMNGQFRRGMERLLRNAKFFKKTTCHQNGD
jgi:hypothetical protein